MRRLIASLLLLAMGLAVPAMAVPSRICFTSLCEKPSASCCGGSCIDCCQDDSSGENGTSSGPSCCMDAPTLPDATPPTTAPVLPELDIIDLGWITAVPPLRLELEDTPVKSKARIRGPTHSPTFRPLLAIWRL